MGEGARAGLPGTKRVELDAAALESVQHRLLSTQLPSRNYDGR